MNPEMREAQRRLTRRLQRMSAALGVALIALLVATGLFGRLMTDSSNKVRNSIEINERLALISDTFIALNDAETGQRGFLLTGKERYLAVYRQAIARIPSLTQSLDRLGASDSDFGRQSQHVHRLADLKLAELAETVALYSRGEHQKALAIVQGDSGQSYMEQLRKELNLLVASLTRQRLSLSQGIISNSEQSARYAFASVGALVACALLAAIQMRQLNLARRRHEQELLRSELQHRSILEEQREMVSLSDESGRLIYVNPAYARQFGYSPIELQGTNVFDWIPAADHVPVRQLHAEVFSSGLAVFGENRMLSADGKFRWVSWSNQLQTGPNGERFLHSVGRDVTTERDLALRLAQRERFLSQITEAVPVGIAYLDHEQRIQFANHAAARNLGRRLAEVIGKTRQELIPDPSQDALSQHLISALEGRRCRIEDAAHSGDARCLDVELIPDLDVDGKVQGVYAVSVDITHRKSLERELLEKHELLRVTLKSIGDAVITTDSKGRVQWMNPVAERMTGWLTTEALGRPLPMVFRIVNEDTRQPAEDPVALCIDRGDVAGLASQTLLISRDGSEYGIEDSAAPIRDEQGNLLGAVLVFHDVSVQRRLSSEMSFRAKHDALTGLVNRAEFEQRLARNLVSSKEDHVENALLFIDLDQFKLVNDACGHSTGDELLCQFSRLLEGHVRARDTVGRLGGDEFGVILEHCPVDQAQRVAQKICDQMEDFRFVHDGRRFRIGTSIGLVPLNAQWTNIAAALQAADISCLAAKEAGRNRVHQWFDTDNARRVREGQTQWASRLAQAIDEDRFELYGQRIVPIGASDEGVHLEVLLRMLDTNGAIIEPGAFLPAAERFHMASRIDRWVVSRVFAWLNQDALSLGHIDFVSVNLSGQSIGDIAFHRFVAELFIATPIPASKLCFEITETSAITNMIDATKFIQQMRALGIRIALDDFGAGASSFGYLRALPVDYLKIDGQFVKDLVDDPLDQAAVRCFQNVAAVIGVKTVAEFVESDAILAILRDIGVDYAQGYLIHRPEPLRRLLANALPTVLSQ